MMNIAFLVLVPVTVVLLPLVHTRCEWYKLMSPIVLNNSNTYASQTAFSAQMHRSVRADLMFATRSKIFYWWLALLTLHVSQTTTLYFDEPKPKMHSSRSIESSKLLHHDDLRREHESNYTTCRARIVSKPFQVELWRACGWAFFESE